ncbi:IclR family transcriptional regulator [Loktanella sp. F6476L]|uniref:IclR family transcriptional regulator n=1 Tax=Loktanella sp. F6476L TaxID=2926405 RepID=UPI001FF2D00B|nr:IclR family transcriptional regulator [Loktanella sp. F6476L]MCK0122201.1 IclR family transcriptional regulator [Loktanella sp. F6476L]
MPKKTGTNDDSKAGKSAVPAVAKAFDIIELLADVEDGLTMNEMVAALGRTMGEIYRIVVYLTEREFLSQNAETGKYAMTLKLFELSHRHDPTDRLISQAVPILERIAARTEQSCHLGVLNRDNVMVLTSAPSPRPAGYAVRTGALFPVERTSSGHVILAFSSQQTQDRYISRLPDTQQPEAVKRLALIRDNGFEDTASTMIHGVRNLCVPVFDVRGIAAAITTGFIAQNDPIATAAETLDALLSAANDLSRRLGYQIADNTKFSP